MNVSYKLIYILILICSFSKAFALGYPVQDDANLLNPSTRKVIEEISSELYKKTKTSFLFKSFEKSSLKDFDKNYVSLLGDSAGWLIDQCQIDQQKLLAELFKNTTSAKDPIINTAAGLGKAFQFFTKIKDFDMTT
ncbi:TPM domain-containing protein, partial [bacterium]|nr:TPM domain-containing protein [bacterium]